MRTERERKKKLTIAFHFYSQDQAGWNCETCRRQGLEKRRRCGFLPEEARGPARLVWIRGGAASEECPKSLVTGTSLELLEKFYAWKAGGGSLLKMRAREAEAMLLLESERRAGNGE